MARRTQAPLSVEAATKAELDELGPKRAAGGLAVAAVALARKIDEGAADPNISPAQLASAVKELRYALTALAPLPAPSTGPQQDPEEQALDELKQARAKRKAAPAG